MFLSAILFLWRHDGKLLCIIGMIGERAVGVEWSPKEAKCERHSWIGLWIWSTHYSMFDKINLVPRVSFVNRPLTSLDVSTPVV